MDDFGEAEARADAALQVFSAAGDVLGTASTLRILALVALAEGRPRTARRLLGEAMALYRECSDPWGVAVCLQEMGQAAQLEGRYDEAWGLLQQALAGFRELQDKIGMVSTEAAPTLTGVPSTPRWA